MERAEEKAQRLLQIQQLLWAHPEGMTRAEIARRVGVNRSTITKYLDNNQLPPGIYEDDLGDHKLKLDPAADLMFAQFNLHEIMAIHLATRLLATRTDKQNPHAAAALRKLGEALQRLDRNVSQHLLRSADVMDESARFRDPVYLKVLETLTEAWSAGRKVKVSHQMTDGRIFDYLLAPYFIEPYAVGQTAHVIGLREPPGALRTLKIERIRSADITHDRYEIPEDFDPTRLLRNAWGIWYGESEPITVTLRFHPRVAARVRETRWHPSQQLEELADGFLLWRGQVAEPQEMLPWIRGWGADCEVVEPKGLRRALMGETRRLAEIYGLTLMTHTERQFYAHSRPDLPEDEWQLLRDHLMATGELAAKLGQSAGISELARIAGTLHDLGKYSAEFQERLHGSHERVDHATAGAKEILVLYDESRYQPWTEAISYAIAGHHSGLPDYGSMADTETDGTLLARRGKKRLRDFSAYKTELAIPTWEPPRRGLKPARFRYDEREEQYPWFSFSFLTRMLFSTLVDADWLETERYMDDVGKPRGLYDSIDALASKLNHYLSRFNNPQTPINWKRTEILDACLAGAKAAPGFFTMTVPTGGGKTLASMAFALNHAREHHLERVIYVIPFTGIIEQNAQVFRDALGELGPQNVLEHHSNFDWERGNTTDDETNQLKTKLKLAAENWDVPIVVTTNVQFFESLFANKKSSARKVHNIAKSVLIFDEVQTLPKEYLKPCLLAIQELVRNYGGTAVFCTATQPSLPRFFSARTPFTELAPDPQGLFDFFRRVRVTDLGTVSDVQLVERLRSHQQALCIVNTRRHARGLFELLDTAGSFHFSTLMCPAHRKATLSEVRRRLNEGQPCRVISTQVMEAGIDVDFPIGFRSLAGLDSIIQAAGRVNREMRAELGEMYVFRPQTEFIRRTPKFIEQTGSVAEFVLRDFRDDPTTTRAIESYYNQLYVLHGEESFDAQRILAHFEKGLQVPSFDFETAAKKFRLIEQNNITVFIPYDAEARRKIEWLETALYPASVLRQLQPYAVNIYEHEFNALQSKGVIQTIADTYHVLDPQHMEAYYQSATGLVIPEHAGGDALFFG